MVVSGVKRLDLLRIEIRELLGRGNDGHCPDRQGKGRAKRIGEMMVVGGIEENGRLEWCLVRWVPV